MGFLSSDYPKLKLLCLSQKKLPQTSCLGHHPCSSILNYILPILCYNSTEGVSFFFTSSDQCLIFVFLGFLTLLANFGLVTPTPDGIRVLGVKTPLRT